MGNQRDDFYSVASSLIKDISIDSICTDITISLEKKNWSIKHINDNVIEARLRGTFHGQTVVYIQKDTKSLIQTETSDNSTTIYSENEFPNEIEDKKRNMDPREAKSLLDYMLENFIEPEYVEILINTQKLHEPS